MATVLTGTHTGEWWCVVRGHNPALAHCPRTFRAHLRPPVCRPPPATHRWHIATKWPGCVKYPATHLVPSAAAPGHVYVAGLDYECAAGRWDGSSGGAAGNANSSSGGHGRAVLPPQLQARQQAQEAAAGAGAAAAVMDDVEGGGRAGERARSLPYQHLSFWRSSASAPVYGCVY